MATYKNNIQFMVLPDYILNALVSRGVSVNDLIKVLDLVAVNRDSKLNNPEQPLEELVSKNLSKQDRNDIVAVSEVLYNDFGITSLFSDYALAPSDLHKTINSIIAINRDDTIDLTRFIMRSDKTSDTVVPFSFRGGSYSVLIVLEKGFFNYKVNNVKGFNFYFLDVLVCYMLKMFGNSATYSHPIFNSLNQRVFLKQ